LKRPTRSALSFTQQQELWLGPSHDGSSFQSEAHRKAMWIRHRDKIMRLWGKGGRRPYAWWRYEAPEIGGLGKSGRRPYEHERSILYDFAPQVLGAEEKLELEKEWRKEFDRTWAPGFSVCREGQVITGQGARELHWIWMDLPLVLHDKWMAERQRRDQVIRELGEESPPEQPADAAAEDEDEAGAAG
jgi:hypothetical protein